MSTHSDAMRFSGALSDGRSAGARPVEVSLGDNGLELRAAEGLPVGLWPYELLRSGVPLRAKAADVLLSLQPDGSQTLFVADPAFAGQLLGRAPALSAARQRWRALRPGLAAVGAVLAIALGIWFFELDPAQAVARIMPQKSREVLGRNFVTALAKDYKACETPASRAALDRLTQRLTAAASSGPMQVRVMLLDWRLVNAFAMPGGQIILTRGLVQTAGSPDEVAGVLAHELGHALELHPETGLVRAMGLAAAAQLIFAGSAGTVSNVGLVLTQLRYTRIAEREADVHALRMLKGAGISPKGFGDFFERLEGKRPRHGGGQEHPQPRADQHPSANGRAHRHGARPAGLSGDAGTLRRGLEGAARSLRAGSAPAGRGRRRRPRDRGGDEDAREDSQRRGGPAEARTRLHQEAPARAGARRLHQGHPAEARTMRRCASSAARRITTCAATRTPCATTTRRSGWSPITWAPATDAPTPTAP